MLLLAGRRGPRWYHVLLLLLFCVVLLAGGILSPMIEVEAKITRIAFTFFGSPLSFPEQVLYFQSKSVLEVFRTLIEIGEPQMWFVGVLVLMFSVVFPTLKILTLAFCLKRPDWLRKYRIARFFALESSKWSMADVMALAIFMSFVAFNGVISNAMGSLGGPGVAVSDSDRQFEAFAGILFVYRLCAGESVSIVEIGARAQNRNVGREHNEWLIWATIHLPYWRYRDPFGLWKFRII